MVGFNQVVDRGSMLPNEIYIPLWSDSIVAVVSIFIFTNQIYIPLWSDSITWTFSGAFDVKLFTFHYGRIQSSCSRLSCSRLCSFTFHYGRIQSMMRFHQIRARSHLHSIMVGFNLVCEPVWMTDSFIYIPLWSDSIGTNAVRISCFRTYLHSIMVGFNPNSAFLRMPLISIYIPLWSDSIADPRLWLLLAIVFTFHYGRIQS